MSRLREFAESLRTADNHLDINKVLAVATFPVYTFAKNLNLQPVGLDVGCKALSNGHPFLSSVALHFALPNHLDEYPRIAKIASHSVEEKLETIVPYSTANMRLSGQFEKKFDWGELKALWDRGNPQLRYNAFSRIVWEEHTASGLLFNIFHRPEPMPLSLGYSNGQVVNVVICAVGLSLQEFLMLLGSVVLVQESGVADIRH